MPHAFGIVETKGLSFDLGVRVSPRKAGLCAALSASAASCMGEIHWRAYGVMGVVAGTLAIGGMVVTVVKTVDDAQQFAELKRQLEAAIAESATNLETVISEAQRLKGDIDEVRRGKTIQALSGTGTPGWARLEKVLEELDKLTASQLLPFLRSFDAGAFSQDAFADLRKALADISQNATVSGWVFDADQPPYLNVRQRSLRHRWQREVRHVKKCGEQCLRLAETLFWELVGVVSLRISLGIIFTVRDLTRELVELVRQVSKLPILIRDSVSLAASLLQEEQRDSLQDYLDRVERKVSSSSWSGAAQQNALRTFERLRSYMETGLGEALESAILSFPLKCRLGDEGDADAPRIYGELASLDSLHQAYVTVWRKGTDGPYVWDVFEDLADVVTDFDSSIVTAVFKQLRDAHVIQGTASVTAENLAAGMKAFVSRTGEITPDTMGLIEDAADLLAARADATNELLDALRGWREVQLALEDALPLEQLQASLGTRWRFLQAGGNRFLLDVHSLNRLPDAVERLCTARFFEDAGTGDAAQVALLSPQAMSGALLFRLLLPFCLPAATLTSALQASHPQEVELTAYERQLLGLNDGAAAPSPSTLALSTWLPLIPSLVAAGLLHSHGFEGFRSPLPPSSKAQLIVEELTGNSLSWVETSGTSDQATWSVQVWTEPPFSQRFREELRKLKDTSRWRQRLGAWFAFVRSAQGTAAAVPVGTQTPPKDQTTQEPWVDLFSGLVSTVVSWGEEVQRAVERGLRAWKDQFAVAIRERAVEVRAEMQGRRYEFWRPGPGSTDADPLLQVENDGGGVPQAILDAEQHMAESHVLGVMQWNNDRSFQTLAAWQEYVGSEGTRDVVLPRFCPGGRFFPYALKRLQSRTLLFVNEILRFLVLFASLFFPSLRGMRERTAEYARLVNVP